MFFFGILGLNQASDDENEDDDEDDVDTNGDDRLKFPTSLPTFSKKIDSCLKRGDFWTNESDRSQFISELAIFFKTNNILVCKSYHYKAIGITILSKYVNFKDSMNKLCDDENKARYKIINKRKPKLIQPWVCLIN
jgi:hypothetical protein